MSKTNAITVRIDPDDTNRILCAINERSRAIKDALAYRNDDPGAEIDMCQDILLDGAEKAGLEITYLVTGLARSLLGREFGFADLYDDESQRTYRVTNLPEV